MDYINPDIEWYISLSQNHNLPPRCPFASAYRCPRYYQSLSLLGEVKISTSIDPEEDKRLLEKWSESDLWPITREQATSASGSPGKYSFSNFCPEVSFDIFGLFASSLFRYSDDDDIDISLAHRQLSKMKAGPTDWRWGWWDIQPMHYSQCPLFSPLSSNPIQINRKSKSRIGF
jgi:hypothetical protein